MRLFKANFCLKKGSWEGRTFYTTDKQGLTVTPQLTHPGLRWSNIFKTSFRIKATDCVPNFRTRAVAFLRGKFVLIYRFGVV